MRRFSIALVMIVLDLGPSLVHADDTPPPPDEPTLYHCKDHTGQVQLTFKPETDLKDLVAWAMGFTCRNFMFDPSYVQRGKKVTVIAPNTMSTDEAYRVFLAALKTIGLTAVSDGKVMRIVESQLAAHERLPVVSHGLPDGGDQLVRYVLRPTYATAANVIQALTPMKSVAGDVQLVGSLIMISDEAATVREMLSVVKLVDVPAGGDNIYTIPLANADADKVAKELDGVLAAPAATGAAATGKDAAPAPTRVIADVRTNQLLVVTSPAGFERLKSVVEIIDSASLTSTGNTPHVYALKSGIAEEIAKTLTDAVSSQTKQPDATKPVAGATPPAAAGAIGTLTLEGQAHIIADKGTNKLIVMSTPRDYIALKSLIQELDEPRREVYLEAMIVEVQLENDLDVGASVHGGLPYGKGGTGIELGGIQTPSLSSTNPASLAGASGLIGGIIGAPLTGAQSLLNVGQSVPSYGLLFQAYAKRLNTTILSMPSTIVLDNEQSTYKIGTNIPFEKGIAPISAANPLSAVTTNIDRKDLLLELDIKPHISSNDTVLLEIKHEAQDRGEDDTKLGPTWTTRTIETRVVVRDQQTVAIGGLMQTRDQSEVDKVPILGDLPLLGRLFSYTTKTKKKSSLMLLITPYIVRDQQDLENIRARKVREEQEFVGSMQVLDGVKWNPRIDYTRKRGLVEEINRSIADIESEVAARAEIARPRARQPRLVAPDPSANGSAD